MTAFIQVLEDTISFQKYYCIAIFLKKDIEY